VDAAGDGELGSERSDGDLRQGDGPIAPALGALDPDLAALELEVLDPQPERLEQAEPAPVQEGGNEAVDAWKGVEQPADLIAREDEREVPRPPGADRGAEALELPADHVAVQEEEAARAWFCVEAEIRRRTARSVRKATTSGAPISRGWRFPRKRMKRRAPPRHPSACQRKSPLCRPIRGRRIPLSRALASRRSRPPSRTRAGFDHG